MWATIPWATLGPSGLCVMFVAAILWGKLLPSATVDRLITARDERIAELKAALDASEKRAEILAEQTSELMEIGRTAEQLMRALPPATGTRYP